MRGKVCAASVESLRDKFFLLGFEEEAFYMFEVVFLRLEAA